MRESARFGGHSLHVKIKFGDSRKASDVETRMPWIPRGIFHGQNVILRIGVSVKNDVVADFWHVKNPVHLGFVVTRHGFERRVRYTEKTVEQVPCRQRTPSQAADHGSSSESEFQE